MQADFLPEPVMVLAELLPESWQAVLPNCRADLAEIEARLTGEFHPKAGDIFAAFTLPPEKVRVLLLGQDPYPTPGVATGRAFAVRAGEKIPASLRNIGKEIGGLPDQTLNNWQQQGVLLLNTVLTYSPDLTVSGENKHANIGWKRFTTSVIEHLTEREVVAIALGRDAQRALNRFPADNLFSTSHPSPLSAYRGFVGSGIFTKVNLRLQELGYPEVNWR